MKGKKIISLTKLTLPFLKYMTFPLNTEHFFRCFSTNINNWGMINSCNYVQSSNHTEFSDLWNCRSI